MVDSNEQLPYQFSDIESNSDNGNLPYEVVTERKALNYLGDYSLDCCFYSLDHLDEASREKYGAIPRIIVERKSKSDFFSSMAKRENFEGRLARLCEEVEYAAVVVEAEWFEIMTDPPEFRKKGDRGAFSKSNMDPRSIHRTVQSWSIEYQKVHWFFYPGREAAESATFWLLYRFWEKFKKHKLNKDRQLENYEAYFHGIKDFVNKVEVTNCPYEPEKKTGDKRDYWCRGWIDMQDARSSKTRGKRICSDPPIFPDQIFSSDYKRSLNGEKP